MGVRGPGGTADVRAGAALTTRLTPPSTGPPKASDHSSSAVSRSFVPITCIPAYVAMRSSSFCWSPRDTERPWLRSVPTPPSPEMSSELPLVLTLPPAVTPAEADRSCWSYPYAWRIRPSSGRKPSHRGSPSYSALSRTVSRWVRCGPTRTGKESSNPPGLRISSMFPSHLSAARTADRPGPSAGSVFRTPGEWSWSAWRISLSSSTTLPFRVSSTRPNLVWPTPRWRCSGSETSGSRFARSFAWLSVLVSCLSGLGPARSGRFGSPIRGASCRSMSSRRCPLASRGIGSPFLRASFRSSR